MSNARVSLVHLEGEPKARHLMVDSVTMRAGTAVRVKLENGWSAAEILPHPDGVRTSATTHMRLLGRRAWP